MNLEDKINRAIPAIIMSMSMIAYGASAYLAIQDPKKFEEAMNTFSCATIPGACTPRTMENYMGGYKTTSQP